jgi:hypothetical protein
MPTYDDERAHHWDSAYETRGASGVSWFQSVPTGSLDLIEQLKLHLDAAIIDIGGGASLLVDHLLERGYHDLSVLEISGTALADARERVGNGAPVSWLHQDLLSWHPERRFDVWHDRAVFHFLTEEADRKAYLDVLEAGISPQGALVMATFAEDGPEYCSGLPVARYSADELSSLLGTEWELVDARREVHTTPTGAAQPFTWITARLKP